MSKANETFYKIAIEVTEEKILDMLKSYHVQADMCGMTEEELLEDVVARLTEEFESDLDDKLDNVVLDICGEYGCDE